MPSIINPESETDWFLRGILEAMAESETCVDAPCQDGSGSGAPTTTVGAPSYEGKS